MKLIDEEPWSWMLFEEKDAFYLDVVCNHSSAEYQFAIRLNEKEVSLFREKGRDALNRLAQAIHYSAPGVIGNSSEYGGRKVSEAVEQRILEAMKNNTNGQQS